MFECISEGVANVGAARMASQSGGLAEGNFLKNRLMDGHALVPARRGDAALDVRRHS